MPNTSRLVTVDVSDRSTVVVCELCAGSWRQVRRDTGAAASLLLAHIEAVHTGPGWARAREATRRTLARYLP